MHFKSILIILNILNCFCCIMLSCHRYVNWVNIMTYDFHFFTRFSPWTGMNSPLYRNTRDKGYFSQLNSNWSIHYWEDQGMPRNMIVMGIPTYGHTFK